MTTPAQPPHSHQAFMLLDAVMGICICASAFALAFGFLYTLIPSHNTTTSSVHKQLFLAPTNTQTTINPHSQPNIAYEVLQHSYTHPHSLETLRFYTPQSIR